MKKLFFSMLYLIALVLPAVAQTADNRVWYDAYRDKECKDYATHYIMDRKAMEFHFDWDSDNEMLIKNYKKNGQTETFDAYYKEEPGKQFAHIVLVTGDTNSNISWSIVLRKSSTTWRKTKKHSHVIREATPPTFLRNLIHVIREATPTFLRNLVKALSRVVPRIC